MAKVVYEDFSIEVNGKISDAINIALEECAGELESQVKRNTRVDTGQTKNSWRHRVDEKKHIAYIGSNHENAIWEEFGTGEHAVDENGLLSGKGRQGGWLYEDRHGEVHFTFGKKPSRAFYTAYKALKNKIVKHLQDTMKGL